MVWTREQRLAADYDPAARRAYNRAYHAKNKEKLLQNNRERWAKNKDRYKEGMRKWRLKNRDYCNAQRKTARGKEKDASLKRSVRDQYKDVLHPTVKGEHMYILRRSDQPDLYKVGRSSNPKSRAYILSMGQCFKVEVVAVHEGQGLNELPAQYALEQYRVLGGISREWFRVPLEKIHSAVGRVLNSNAASAASTPGSSSSDPPPPVVAH